MMAGMETISRRLLMLGTLVIAGGVIFETLATNLLAQLFSLQGGAGGGVGLWLTDFIVSIVRFGLAPLGASLLALGIAAHLVRNKIPALSDNHMDDE